MLTARAHALPAEPMIHVDVAGRGRRVDQVTPTFDRHDAISNEALLVRDALRVAGFRSNVLSPMIALNAVADVDPFESARLAGADLVVCHFAIGSATAETISRRRGRRALWYHNITPSSYYRRYEPAIAYLLDLGRDQLAAIAGRFDALFADSQYNARELAAFTETPVNIVPFPIDFRRFAVPASMPGHIPAARVRWLCVGRIAPSKGLLRLVRSFHASVQEVPDSQLVLVGSYRSSDPFHLRLRHEIERLGLQDRVVITGALSDGALSALYQSADVYVTLSQHEGFCVPLVEAMFFEVPIVASTAGAIPETLGDAGLMVEDNATHEDVAALVDLVLTNEGIRSRVVKCQNERRTCFLPENLGGSLSRAIEQALR